MDIFAYFQIFIMDKPFHAKCTEFNILNNLIIKCSQGSFHTCVQHLATNIIAVRMSERNIRSLIPLNIDHCLRIILSQLLRLSLTAKPPVACRAREGRVAIINLSRGKHICNQNRYHCLNLP